MPIAFPVPCPLPHNLASPQGDDADGLGFAPEGLHLSSVAGQLPTCRGQPTHFAFARRDGADDGQADFHPHKPSPFGHGREGLIEPPPTPNA
jgi:hypothetical protein